jgi:hypothetical protein
MARTFRFFLGILIVGGALACSKGDGGGATGEGGSAASGGTVGSGGNGSGGANATGGSASGGMGGRGGATQAAGGRAGQGGAVQGTGGGIGRGGTTGQAGATGTGGAAGSALSGSCTVTVSSSTISSKISTVGIVKFTTTASSPTEAHIDFGLDTSYGMTAPVDLTATDYRTLLLGMKASKTYHYRISVTGKDGTCTSADTSLATGALPNGRLPQLTVTTKNASALFGGFIVTGQFIMGGGSSGAPVFILDKDGDYVWWYTVANGDVTGVTMSYDGNYLWANSVNVPQGTAHVFRISMDGATAEDDSSQFTGLSHQLSVLPDETVAFYAYGSNGCDDIKLRSPSGTVTTVVNAKTAHGGSGGCHLNGIYYDKNDDTLVFSDLDNNCLTKITRSGQTVWILNGGVGGITSNFNNGALLWKGGEHGFHILASNDILLFNNNSTVNFGGGSWGSAAGDGSGSVALEVKLDTSAKTATQVWSYKASPGIDNQVLGDVQRLPNGNTIVDYATKGAIHEVDANGNVLQTITTNNSFGYLQKRATLYGPPPR